MTTPLLAPGARLLRGLRPRRTWALALLLAVLGALLVGPSAHAAPPDLCDKVPGQAADWCQRDDSTEAPKQPPSLDDPAGLTPNCKNAPAPAMPGSGPAAWADTPPKKPLAPLDPKSPEARAHLYEQYGLSGFRWSTYDLGCSGTGVGEMISAASSGYETKVANWLYSASTWWTSLAVSLQQEATGDGYLNKLNVVFGDATKAVAEAIYRPWISISLLVLGLGIVYQARRKNLPDATKSAVWALLVMTVTSVVFNWPQEAGKLADAAVTETVGRIQQGVAGDAAHGSAPATSQGNLIASSILYEGWATGVFGDSKSPTARKYGTDLFDAQALTWAEAKLPPKERATVINAKAKKWETLAAKVKAEDSTAYAHLTGAEDGRLGTAVNTALGAIPTNAYSFMSSIAITCARLILKMIGVFLPAIAALAIHRQLSGTLRTVGKSAAAAVINAPVFVLAASLDTLLIQVLLQEDNHLPHWFAIVLIWIITAMLWAMSKPFRKISSMVSPNSDWFGGGVGILGKAKTMAFGAALGYAKGKVNARQIGSIINPKGSGASGRGGGGGLRGLGRGRGVEDRGDADEQLPGGIDHDDEATTRRFVRREGEPWSEETEYEPGPVTTDHDGEDTGYWVPDHASRPGASVVPYQGDGQQPAVGETAPEMHADWPPMHRVDPVALAKGAAVQQEVRRRQADEAERQAQEARRAEAAQQAAEAQQRFEEEQRLREEADREEAERRAQRAREAEMLAAIARAVGEGTAAGLAGHGRTAPPPPRASRSSQPPRDRQGTYEAGPSSPPPPPPSFDGDRPIPVAPEFTEADGSRTFVIYSPTSGYSTHHDDGPRDSGSTPEDI
ncbi:hypothetical protein [Streptomyces sp. Ac-502]|uniref:hypothetical protein n=1 Tax=Streptomyces sp. Ac-502 TaxID=3342801 RepID=UPI003862D0D3